MNRCPICRRSAETVHPACAKRLNRRLSDLPALYALMAAVLEPGTAAGARVSGSRTPPLPVRLEPLNLRAPGGIVTILATWELDWREARGFTDGPERGNSTADLAAIVMFLRAHLPWAIEHHQAVAEFACEVGDLTASCYAAAGLRSDSMRIGTCPTMLADDQPCATALYADPYADAIRCRRCRATWSRPQWMMLGKTLREVEGERLSA